MVLGGFQKDLGGFLEDFRRVWGGENRRARISGPLRKVCPVRKEVSVWK